MIDRLLKYAKDIPAAIIKRDDLMDEIDDIYSNIRNDIRPMISIALEVTKKSDIKLSSVPMVSNTEADRKYKMASKLVVAIDRLIKDFEDNKDELIKYTKEMPNSIATKGITTNQALSINVLENINFFIEYSGDVLISILETISETEDSVFTKKIISKKKYLFSDWYNILNNYTSFNNVLVDLGNMTITNDSMIAASIDKDVNVVTRFTEMSNKGFIGNPIFHLRIFLVDRDIKKIKVLTKKKEYVELLLAELELKQANQYDDSLNESIENAKELINDYEAKIEKLSR